VSGANVGAEVSDEIATVAAETKHEPVIQVIKGAPTDEDVAAIVAVLAAGSGSASEPREQEVNLWGHPVDRLRYTTFSWQLVTLLERTHMRRH
jgi:Acyl-CoA carboxylase epsilon subunit